MKNLYRKEWEAHNKNIIIHGFKKTGNTNEITDDDNNTRKDLFNILKIDYTAWKSQPTKLVTNQNENEIFKQQRIGNE